MVPPLRVMATSVGAYSPSMRIPCSTLSATSMGLSLAAAGTALALCSTRSACVSVVSAEPEGAPLSSSAKMDVVCSEAVPAPIRRSKAKAHSSEDTSLRIIVYTPTETNFVIIMTTKSNGCYFCYHIVTNHPHGRKGKTAHTSPVKLVEIV